MFKIGDKVKTLPPFNDGAEYTVAVIQYVGVDGSIVDHDSGTSRQYILDAPDGPAFAERFLTKV